MVSRSLARRALLLGIWAIGMLVLLDLREPGFWREALRLVPASRPRAASEVASTPRSASAPPVSAARPEPASPVATPPPQTAPALEIAREPAPAAPARAAGVVRPRPDDGRGRLYARVSEAWRLDARGEYARAWQVASSLPEGDRDPQILRLKALTALWAHENEDAARLTRLWTARAPGDAEAALALAQAELQRGRAAAARPLLDAVARDASLTADQTLQLAALQAWAGDAAGAAASAREVLARRPDDPQALRTLAAALARGDGDAAEAEDAIARARVVAPDDAELELLAARVAVRRGEGVLAGERYAAYLERRPGDADAQLEAARFAVNAGDPGLAVDRYRAVADARGEDGFRVELARALLAAARYEEAEEVARRALGSSEDGPEARLALAQSVYLQGRPREAAALFTSARDAARSQPVDATYAARLAMAQDRDLDAWMLLGDRLEGEAPPEPASASSPAELWLLRGRVAEKRGDLRRAREAYVRAADEGAPLQAQLALRGLAAATRPHAGAAYSFFEDANRLEVNGGAAWLELRPGDAARVTVEALAQVVSQDEARFTRTGGRIGFGELYPAPEWSLAGSFGFVNSSAGGGDVVTGSFGVRRFFADGSVLGLTGYREPLLGGHEDLDPRLWNRIIDLGALGPSFAINGGKLYLDQLLREDTRDRLWLQLGAENYEDGNLRGILYAHVQLPLRTAPDDWTVVRPNAFVEAFKRVDVPEYFSPTTHATVGLAGHTIRRRGGLRLEAEVNPQLLVTDGQPGFGVHALLDASVDVGPANVGVSGFAFYDGIDDYWLARAMARVEVVF
jgi:Flp pilus assembly protein TadD